MAIRHATAKDYEGIRELVVGEKLSTSGFFTRERFKKALENFGRYYLVEEQDGRIIGCVSGFDDGGAFYGWMMRGAVVPEFRRQGIIEELTLACLEEFRKAGIPLVFAGVHETNIAARNLVEKLGFVDEECKLVYKEF